MAAATPHPQADFIAGIHADGADQFLISYLTLTRFPQSSPYALGFALGHAFELSLKAVYWFTKRTFPDSHLLDALITSIGADLKREMDAILPDRSVRDRFKDAVKPMMEAPVIQQIRTYFEFIPTGDDDAWLVLFILYILADVKYGVDRKQRILQLMPVHPPKLNAMALRAIGCARRHFPNAGLHRGEIEKFIVAYAVKAPIKGITVAQLERLVAAGQRSAALEWQQQQDDRINHAEQVPEELRRKENDTREKADREVSAVPGQQTREPKSFLVFTSEELKLIKEVFGLQLRTDLEPDV